MSAPLQIIDAENQPIVLGAKVDGGNGVSGEVVRISEGEEQGPYICVLWPDLDGEEVFSCSPRDFRKEGPSGPFIWKCYDVAVVDG